MMKLYLIRHGEAEGNLYRRIHGWYNSIITPDGHRQIAALQARFEGVPIDAVYSSDLCRAMTTAGAIFKPRGLPLNTRTDLREIHLGRWEDATWGEVALREPELLDLFNRFSDDWNGGGETFLQLRTRLRRAIFEIAAAHPDQTIAVVSHGTGIRSLLGSLHGYTNDELKALRYSDNTAVSYLEIDGDSVRIVFENDNTHLPEELSTFAKQRWWREHGDGLDANLWFCPLDLSTAADFFYEARREAWEEIHGSLRQFDGDGFLQDARAQAQKDPRAVWCAMMRDTPAGILQLNLQQEAGQGIGRIPFFYLLPEFRRRGLGVQLIGQAVSVYRPLGRRALRLRCAPDNTVAQRFYARHGFEKIGTDPGSRVPLDLLEKSIEVPQ